MVQILFPREANRRTHLGRPLSERYVEGAVARCEKLPGDGAVIALSKTLVLSTSMAIEPDRLRHFLHTFYGYGSWTAPLWFIGMEEGGGDSLDEIERRLAAWNGGDELVDLRAFHRAIGGTAWFRHHPPLQRTWSKLARIALAAEGRDADADAIRRYQRDELAASHSTTALIELFPLPSPSVADWIYAATGIPEIATRNTYIKALQATRISTIRSRIDEHHPRAVVFYGRSYRDKWAAIAGQRFSINTGLPQLETTIRGSTRLVLAPHPTSHGVPNTLLDLIGRYVA